MYFAERTVQLKMFSWPRQWWPVWNEGSTLSVMAGGDTAVIEAYEPLFEVFAKEIFHVGTQLGHRYGVKLLNNRLSFTALLATQKAVPLITPPDWTENARRCLQRPHRPQSATQEKIPETVITDSYDLGFTLNLMSIDTRLFTEFGQNYNTPLLLGDTVKNLVGCMHGMWMTRTGAASTTSVET